MRKYLSLVPSIKKKNVNEVILIGGAYSNNVLGLTQLAIENGFKPILFLREAANALVRGNRLFIELLVEKRQIHWITREQWVNVENIAKKYAVEQEKLGISSFIVPEGACIDEAIPGALTLPLDLINNEIEGQLTFDHVFIEAGSGLQSIALILGLSRLKPLSTVHVVLLADGEEVFIEKLKKFHAYFNELVKEKTILPNNFQLHRPKVAPSFGAVNAQVIDQIGAFARAEGVFLDPIYSAKLMMTGKQVIQEKKLTGNILFIHSGGALALSGFQENLMPLSKI